MGDLLFFVYTSTPHRHRVPPERFPERKEDDWDIHVIQCEFSISIHVILHEYKAKKGVAFHGPLL